VRRRLGSGGLVVLLCSKLVACDGELGSGKCAYQIKLSAYG